jgi:DNA replication protein DnaC
MGVMFGIHLKSPILKRMGIPEVHWKAVYARIPNECEHKRIVHQWCANVRENLGIGDFVTRPRGVLLLGDYSRGKSAIAAICLKAAASVGVIGFWVTVRELAAYQIEKTQFDESQTIWDRALTCPLLVLDDIPAKSDTYTAQALDSLVRHRVDAKKCCILTANLTQKYLSEHYQSLYAVLREAVVPVVIEGPDFRKLIAEEKQ